MVLKIRGETKGPHVQATIFAGSKEGRLACTGLLVFRPAEYQTFIAVLKEGSKGFNCEVIEEFLK